MADGVDVEALDDRLAMSWEQFISCVVDVSGGYRLTGRMALAVFGTFGLVLYSYPWLGFAFVPLAFFYVSVLEMDAGYS